MRTLHNPSAGTTIVGILKPHEGGSGQVTGSTALNAMAAITLAAKNQATGVAGLDKDGRVSASVISPELFSTVSINGPKAVNKGSDTVYTIRNYDSFSEYAISSTLGTVSVVDDLITYSAPSVVGEAGFFVNGREFKIQVIDTAPATPTITSPVNLSNLTTTGYTFTTSAYSVPDAASTHAGTDWWLSTRPDFSDTVARVNDSATDKTSWTVINLTDGQTYYVNARHKSSSGIYSEWSPGVSFTVSVPMPATPTITSHANNVTVNQSNQTFTSSAYNITGNASPHLTSDWQLSVVSDFSTIFASAIESSGNLSSWSVSGLADGGTYYVRTRHKATNGKSSAWSAAVRINILLAFTFNTTVAASVNNYNMRSAAVAAGWNQVTPLAMSVTVNSGVVIGSTTNTNYAFDTGAGFPAGSNLTVNIASGAYVVGCGGAGGGGENGNNSTMGNMRPSAKAAAGGPALIARQTVTISNMGVIGGGGGGGGGGAASAYLNDSFWGSAGSGGGGGAGSIVGLGGAGGLTHPERTSPPEPGFAGSAGTLTTGGQGGAANVQQMNPIGYPGGVGGNLGQAGGLGGHPYGPSEATIASPAGAGGAAVTGNGNITWSNTGTRLGQIT